MFRSFCVVATFFLASFATFVVAENLPGGWTLSDEGVLSKGTSYVQMFDQVDLDGVSLSEYAEKLKESKPKPGDVIVSVSVGAIDAGKYVVQLKRVIERDGVQAHSVLLLCKGGQFKHHLFEIFVERTKVLDIITAGRYAIGVCAA